MVAQASRLCCKQSSIFSPTGETPVPLLGGLKTASHLNKQTARPLEAAGLLCSVCHRLESVYRTVKFRE